MLLACSMANGQVFLRVIPGDGNKDVQKLDHRKKFRTKDEAYKEISDLIFTLQYRGYLLAAVDTVITDSSLVTARISANELFKSARLRMGNLDPNLASKLGLSEKLYFNKPYRHREVARSIEKILSWYENHGHPFAAVKLDSVEISGNILSAAFNVEKNRFYRIDSIKVTGTAKVNNKFLFRYLSIKEGMPYDESSIRALSRKLSQLPFVTEKRPQEVRLTERTNRLILFLDKKEASQFDGIIGLLPDADTKKTIITGDLKLKVVNGIFRNGETFDLEWRRLKSLTQDFNGRVIYPYLFGTPVGTDYALKIYRRDTTFIDITNNIGLQYYFSGLNNFKVFYRNRAANLISTSGLELLSTLPEYADVSTRSYGLGIAFEDLDYRFNPKKGLSITSSAQTGDRIIRKNPRLNPVAYEGLLLRSTQYQLEGQFAFFLPVTGNNVIRIGLQAASVFGNSVIFRNELFRIGGLKTLRGFDEESIFASTYVIPTIEYRFLFARNSNLLLFAEGAWYENNSNRQYMQDTPVSIGAGINFETKAGILTLNYAIGNQFGNGFDARSGKIHFGLTALF